MEWKDFFNLSVMKEGPQGSHPYFHSELKVPDEFTMEELLMKEFEYLDLPEQERKYLSLAHRKILLRERYFHCAEFERITLNFIERLYHEKEHTLSFSTQGGGIYLFIALLKHPEIFKEKKLICYTSDLPLQMHLKVPLNSSLEIIIRSDGHSYFRQLPSLWQQAV